MSFSFSSLYRLASQWFTNLTTSSSVSDDVTLDEETPNVETNQAQAVKLYQCFFQLGLRSMALWYHTRSSSTLEECIRLLRTAISLCPSSTSERETLLFSLAIALDERYTVHGATVDLQNCITFLREVLELRAPDHPDRSGPVNNLAVALCTRYSRFGELSDLEESIRLYQEALTLHPVGHPDRLRDLNNLSSALSYRYIRLGNDEDLAQRICLLQEAVELSPEGHPDRSASLNNLAAALSSRYAQLGDIADLEEQIHLHQEALSLRPNGHPNRLSSLNNFAIALSARYARLGDMADLEECIRMHQEAFELCPKEYPHRSEYINNLAVALSERYERLGDISDLEEHVRLHHEALELCPKGHPDRAGSLNNLAIALGARFTRLRDTTDLEEHVRLHKEALELRPKGHPSRSISLNNLAVALSDRYEHLGDIADLEQHIELYREALMLHPEGHPDRSVSLNNLAVALNDRYSHLRETSDLEECIQLFQEALALRPEGHPSRSMSLVNLANAYCKRYALLRDVADLEMAISYVRSSASDSSSSQAILLHCSFRWIELAEEHGHNSLEEAIVSAVSGFRRYLSIGPTPKLQYTALLRDTSISSLPTDAAAYFLDKGDVERAVQLLDEGRALLISEMRRFREPLTRNEQAKIGEEFSCRYLDLCNDIRHLANPEVRFESFSSSPAPSKTAGKGELQSDIAYGELVKQKRIKLEAYECLLDQIRQMPGCEEFQQSLKFEKLKHAADGGPIVIVNCSERRSDVIIVFSDRSPMVIPLDNEFYEMMSDTYDWFREKMKALNSRKDIGSTISTFLAPIAKQLWNKVVRKVVETLQDNGIPKGFRIWWCPTSFLTSLPLHAAGYGSEWLIDYYVSSYTPTLSALISARQTAIQKPSSPRILVVAQTVSSGLKHAKKEVIRMTKLGSFVDLVDEQEATPVSVIARLPPYNWAHFICHGTVSDNPFDSSLLLYNESKLSLNDILKAHLPDGQFAFLAACHSAELNQGETVLQDEVLHLAGAMQVSGFRSVVGTMWQMEDKDGPRLAEDFYGEMLEGAKDDGERHMRAARALWKVTRWMKNERNLPIARWANYIHIGS